MNHVIVLGVDGVVREFRADAADDIIEDQLDLPRGSIAERKGNTDNSSPKKWLTHTLML